MRSERERPRSSGQQFVPGRDQIVDEAQLLTQLQSRELAGERGDADIVVVSCDSRSDSPVEQRRSALLEVVVGTAADGRPARPSSTSAVYRSVSVLCRAAI